MSFFFVHLPCLQPLTAFAAGTEHGSGYSIQARSKTRVMRAATAAQAVEDTATSTPKLPQKAMSRKRSREGSNEPLPAPKKAAVLQAEDEDEEMKDVDAIPTAMEADCPSTRAAARSRKVDKARRQRRAWH